MNFDTAPEILLQLFIISFKEAKTMFLSTRSPWEKTTGDEHFPVPKNLFPKSTQQVDHEEWQKSTYQYYSCFDGNIRSRQYECEEDLSKWKQFAVTMIDELLGR